MYKSRIGAVDRPAPKIEVAQKIGSASRDIAAGFQSRALQDCEFKIAANGAKASETQGPDGRVVLEIDKRVAVDDHTVHKTRNTETIRVGDVERISVPVAGVVPVLGGVVVFEVKSGGIGIRESPSHQHEDQNQIFHSYGRF